MNQCLDLSETYPLTAAQRDIWLDQMTQGDSPLYSIAGYIQIKGRIDPERFQRAIELLVQKHDALRTVLLPHVGEEGAPMQALAAAMVARVELQDFSDSADPEAALQAWMQQQIEIAFPLDGRQLFRFHLAKLSETSFYFVAHVHHLIQDGWGISLMFDSVGELYTALDKNEQPDLSAPSYVEFVHDDVRTASALEPQLRQLKGIGNVTSSSALQRPEIQMHPDFARAAEQGITSQDIADTLRMATYGEYSSALGKINLSQRQVDVRVRMDPLVRNDLDAINQLRVTGRDGQVALASLGELRMGSGPAQIMRLDRLRNITLFIELNGRTLGEVMAEVTQLPVMLNLPSEVKLVESGERQLMSELFGSAAVFGFIQRNMGVWSRRCRREQGSNMLFNHGQQQAGKVFQKGIFLWRQALGKMGAIHRKDVATTVFPGGQLQLGGGPGRHFVRLVLGEQAAGKIR